MIGTWLGENSSCSCVTVLPGSAWDILNKIYQVVFTPLYRDGKNSGFKVERSAHLLCQSRTPSCKGEGQTTQFLKLYSTVQRFESTFYLRNSRSMCFGCWFPLNLRSRKIPPPPNNPPQVLRSRPNDSSEVKTCFLGLKAVRHFCTLLLNDDAATQPCS